MPRDGRRDRPSDPREGVEGYPHHWEADVVLRDGGTAHLRPILPGDKEELQAFHLAQSPESIYLRFFAPLPRLSERDLQRFTEVDYDDRVAIVATVAEHIIGIGRYDRVGQQEAEVAFNIADAHHGRGLGSVLLEHLAVAARERGVHRFVAEVLPQNRKMVGVFKDAGYEVKHAFDDGVISLGFDIDPTERSLEVMAAREHRSEATSIKALLNPRSVVVVGASRDPDSVGAVVMSDLLSSGFTGAVHAVNPEALEVQGVQSHARVRDVPGPVDLAVLAVPARAATEVVEDCARIGVKGLVVISSGFAETGPEGAELQAEMVAKAHAYGMRVVGPNSFGMINTDPAVRLNASLAPRLPSDGQLGLFSQSGALSVAVLAAADRRGLGVSSFVSAGNRADVSGNDLMQYWGDDERTSAVGLYLESVGNPRKFSRIARRLARSKPVVAVKSGASGYGAPPGHQVRTSRVPREAFDALLGQAGVIRVENLHQLLDVSQILVDQPLPAGNRIGVVGNSDALAALTAEAAVDKGLQIAIPPVTLPAQADAASFRTALEQVFSDDRIDAVVACFIPPLASVDEAVAKALVEVAGASEKTCVACLLGMRGVGRHEVQPTDDSSLRVVPSYPTPEDAVRALAGVAQHANWKRKAISPFVVPTDIDTFKAQVLVEQVLAEAPNHPAGIRLDPPTARTLLKAYGISLWQAARVADADEAVKAAEEIGYPVVLKSASESLRAQWELGGIRVGIDTPGELRRDVAALIAGHGDRGDGFLVQAMAPPGASITLRSSEDPLFGPVVSFGLAGDASELLGDVSHRIPPLSEQDIEELICTVKAAPRLYGYRGTPKLDVDALKDLISRVGKLADDLPEVAELTLTPVRVHEEGLSVLGARVRLANPAGRKDAGMRRI